MASMYDLPSHNQDTSQHQHHQHHQHHHSHGSSNHHHHTQSWSSVGSNGSLYSTPFKNPFSGGHLHPDSSYDGNDNFNPNGLAHSGHTRTHSFNGQRSPLKSTFRSSISELQVPSPVMEQLHDHYEEEEEEHHHHHHHNSHSHGHGHDHDHEHDHHLAHDHDHDHEHGHGHGHVHGHVHVPATRSASSSWFSLPEALTGLLIPMPYLLASAAYSTSSYTAESTDDSFPPLSAYTETKLADQGSSLLQACTLTSGTLLMVGILASIRQEERVLDRRKGSSPLVSAQELTSLRAMGSIVLSALTVGLPYYAAMQLGGMRVGLIILAAIASGMACSGKPLPLVPKSQTATLAVILPCLLADLSGMTLHVSSSHLVSGYLALIVSIATLQPPLPINAASASPLTATPADVTRTLAAGGLLSVISVVLSILLSISPSVSALSITLSTLSMAVAAGLVLFADPSALRTPYKAGMAMGCLVTAASSFLFSPSIWPGTVCNGALAALSYVAALYDASPHFHDDDDAVSPHHHHHHHDGIASHHPNTQCHHNHDHDHEHDHAQNKVSILTSFLLARCQAGSLMHSILSERDSRRIAYFTCLNFAFMLVQAFYGWISGSLGLLSDTVHMFFDCLALVVGLGAAVASKWPTSPEMPFGWGKLNTLAGFGNGIFLMLVSVEFVWEAIEGMMEGKELRHVQELLVVSVLGFLVNMVGLLAFGHAHAGHDHGHGHSHGHGHDHSHDHGHAHDSHAHAAAHGHENENMHGIYLHIAADAGGSLAVILSTCMTLYSPWYLWDPLATIGIALLIFLAAVPLVKESGRKLLLVIPDQLQYALKNALQELAGLRGVTGYAVPRFWVEEEGAGDAHGHAHAHDHGHDHQEEKKVKVLGVIHVFASRAAEPEDVRETVVDFFRERDMDVVVQVEREGEGRCWCGGGVKIG